MDITYLDVDRAVHPQSGFKPTVTNVVCSVDLKWDPDHRGRPPVFELRPLVEKIANATQPRLYPQKHRNGLPALQLKTKSRQSTAMFFATGKLICVGAKTVNTCLREARKWANDIRQLVGVDNDARVEVQIVNIVAFCPLPFKIKLAGIVELGKGWKYEPELFPGASFKYGDHENTDSKVSFSVFDSGSINIAGAKSLEELHDAFEVLYTLLREKDRLLPRK